MRYPHICQTINFDSLLPNSKCHVIPCKAWFVVEYFREMTCLYLTGRFCPDYAGICTKLRAKRQNFGLRDWHCLSRESDRLSCWAGVCVEPSCLYARIIHSTVNRTTQDCRYTLPAILLCFRWLTEWEILNRFVFTIVSTEFTHTHTHTSNTCR